MFFIGQKVTITAINEPGLIVSFIETSGGTIYKVQIEKYDGETDHSGNPVGLFTYRGHELSTREFMRFVRFGDHHLSLGDESGKVGGGTWGVKDVLTDAVVMYVTAHNSFQVVNDLCRAMNDGVVGKGWV